MTITIPKTGRGDNPLTVTVNGVTYKLARGTEITVPDAVGAEAQRMLGLDLLPGSGYAEDARILPIVDSTFNGKILTVKDGKWVAADAPTELPAVNAETDAGKVLTVVDGGWAAAALPTGGDT